jgi:F-type H+-transporting ATPase subunit b
MNLAVTLVIQGVVFFVVAWVVMRFVAAGSWRPSRSGRRKLPTGLAAASKSEKDLDEAKVKRSKEIIREARDRAAQIVDQAGKRSNEIVEEAKGTASSEAQRWWRRRTMKWRARPRRRVKACARKWASWRSKVLPDCWA